MGRFSALTCIGLTRPVRSPCCCAGRPTTRARMISARVMPRGGISPWCRTCGGGMRQMASFAPASTAATRLMLRMAMTRWSGPRACPVPPARSAPLATPTTVGHSGNLRPPDRRVSRPCTPAALPRTCSTASLAGCCGSAACCGGPSTRWRRTCASTSAIPKGRSPMRTRSAFGWSRTAASGSGTCRCWIFPTMCSPA